MYTLRLVGLGSILYNIPIYKTRNELPPTGFWSAAAWNSKQTWLMKVHLARTIWSIASSVREATASAYTTHVFALEFQAVWKLPMLSCLG